MTIMLSCVLGDDNHVGCYSPDVNFFQEDESGEQFHPVTSEPATSQQNNSGRRLAITTSKVALFDHSPLVQCY